MSRFGLRSYSDGLKLSEEKPNRRKTANPTSIIPKRTTNQKETKFSAHLSNNEDNNIIDDIKIEVEELEKCPSDTCDKLVKHNNNADNDEDDEEANENDNDYKDENDCRQLSPICQTTLVCSLPLERINEIIKKLNLNKPKVEIEKESEEIMIDETMDNDDDEEDDANISKQSASNIKNLCLYCDRKFSSHKMQLKHVDKFHCLQQDRRCSGRNAQLQQQSQNMPRKRKSSLASQNFPGCNLCHKTKGQTQQPVILPATELSSLFLHLTDCHTDKYFGCKTCVIRFQNISKLSKHMEVVHKSLPFAFDESSSKSKDNDTDSLVSMEKLTASGGGERSKLSMKRQQRSQKLLSSGMNIMSTSVGTAISMTPQSSTAITPNTSVIGAEEPILSRLGLTQNRLPNNRKGVRLRREKLLPEMLLKSEQNNHHHTSSTNFAFGPTTSLSASTSSSIITNTCSPKLRGKSLKSMGGFSGDTSSDVIFRVPTRNDILSCVFDDNFYKEVVSNVRNNLLFHVDGKIRGNSLQELDASLMRQSHQPQIRSTLVKSPIVVTTIDSEIHAATSLAAVTAFPTLLTAQQFGGDTGTSKIRRPHTKNSWKWKWDNVKKFKLINEGGKIIKKMKHPMLGLRDLSKLDMWTQLTMRQKHELQQQQKVNLSPNDNHWPQVICTATTTAEISNDPSREEKQRVNDQLNFILDMRLLPHIILEQNEQAIIKLENDEFGIAPLTKISNEDCGDSFMAQTFADEGFLSMLNLLPNYETQNTRTKLVLSGEWARPRCYLCICCGCKFEKLKSLEEHKMFRHSQILSTHYEVVGRELLNGNLLRHLFLPKKALSRYGYESDKLIYTGAARRLFWHKNETIIREIANNEESSDSLQSMVHSCVASSPSLKNSSSSTEDCDLDSKISTSVALQLIGNAVVVSPTHSIQSCSSTTSSASMKRQSKMSTSLRTTPVTTSHISSSSSSSAGYGCSKCGRKCNGVLDLYRHMLDCSGDYVWSLAKKRKYRYYCGSKKRRPCNKHGILELRKNKNKTSSKSLSISNDNTNEEGAVSSSSLTRIKTSPRSRPSDAESIKKMLENLPPKRVCKKIFPTLNKTKKKSVKNIKPKLLAKHKMYNSLRKTRVRQLTQAAKILSKTKSQLKGSKKMVTRSTATTVTSKVKQNRANKNKKNIKLAMKKNSERKFKTNPATSQEINKINKLEKMRDEVDCFSIKTEQEQTKEALIKEPNQSDKIIEDEKNDQIQKQTEDKNIPANTKENVQQTSENEQLLSAISKNMSAQTEDVVANVNLMQKDITLATHDNERVNKAKCPNPSTTIECERITASNVKAVKRSKRISDCIAMLTGKLEEKLKTEQKILVPLDLPPPTTVIAPTLKTVSSNSPKPLPTPTPSTTSLQPAPVNWPKPSAETLQSPENCSPKKTPKRKALSRKIIKTDIIESSSSPVPTTTTTSLDITKSNVSPKLTKKVEIMPPPKELLPAKPTKSATAEIVTAKVTPKNLTKLLFTPGENKPAVNFMTNKVVPTMPPPLVAPPTPSSSIMPKMPLFIPLENIRPAAMAPNHMATMSIPMSLPVPVPVPVPLPIENVTQKSPGSIASTVPAIGASMIPTPVIPILTAVPAHLAHSPALQLAVSSFNPTNTVAEPLNLSNTSKNLTKQSQDLSCAGGVQRISGMPARRQTICGFEVRNFTVFDEMEPLDLSKKPRPEKPANTTTAFATRQMEVTPLLLPPLTIQATQQPATNMGLISESTVLAMPPLTPEALLNKPFYSNLDLLRIPQVRNPVGCQNHLAVNTNEPVQTTNVINSTAIVLTPPAKATNKKRSKPLALQTTINANLATTANTSEVCLVGNTTTTTTTMTSNAKINHAKDITNNNSKKEATAKNKSILRMDEEVINHIDDAINSVINAVKASLDSEEALKAQELMALNKQTLPNPLTPTPLQPLIQLKTTDDVNGNKKIDQEFKHLTAARRNMRSKTLDCRPAALSKTCNKTLSNHINLQTVNETVNADVSKPIISNNNNFPLSQTTNLQLAKSKTNKNSEIIKCLDNKLQINDGIIKQAIIPESFKLQEETKKTETHLKILEMQTKPVEKPSNEIFKHQTKKPNVASINEKQLVVIENTSQHQSPAIISSATITNTTCLAIHEDVEAKITSTTISTKPINLLDLEQMSNNNNTSSGFHSSAQSDQQTSVMSNSTSAISITALETAGGNIKKKQRRRRKNELAAIVADQLLESFKLDKARRDNLKKLENLAYEKSEDLLLTGMLLMSSTKRNVNTGSSSNLNAPVETTETPSSLKRSGKSQRNLQNNETQKQVEVLTAAENKTQQTEVVSEKTFDIEKDPLEVSETVGDGKKNNTKQRRQYRRRGKTLDNENISKLKSSLESFSIDIERQLTEYEAKNVNVFKNVPSKENAKQTGSAKNQTPANANKSSIVLRPSLLSSVTLEASNNIDIPQTTSKTLNNDSNKTTIVSSRDPRLNKNIHKEGEKNPETILPSDAKKEHVLTEKNSAAPGEIGDLEEDNYLTEIAKNVNEKIMSTENEEFAFKNDGFELVNDVGMDDSNSKYSRPPTSMSVRSAPNFNDDRSNFGSICDENTNTEVMDMDLDDEMSVYTSYSQDLGRGRGRRRRRRRSVLLTRKPKKRASSRDMSAEKIECILCKKVFFSANSLSKHNMTLAHVSKVSEQEYLLSKTHTNLTHADELQTYGTLGPYARRTTRRNTISEPPMQSRCDTNPSPPVLAMLNPVLPNFSSAQSTQPFTLHSTPEAPIKVTEDLKPLESNDTLKSSKSLQNPNHAKEQISDQEYYVNTNANNVFNGNSRLNLNPDERLFFECCNILKSAETPRLNNAAAAKTAEECNINTNFSYSYNQDKLTISSTVNVNRPPINNLNMEPAPIRCTSSINANQNQLNHQQLTNSNIPSINQQSNIQHQQQQQQQTLFRDPHHITQSNCYNKAPLHDNRNERSPTYSAISHLSAVTNTTSRFKTKAAMKGYENVNIDLNHQHESKSRTICKLTELAEIALGNEEKPNSHGFSPRQNSLTPPQVSSLINQTPHQAPKENVLEIGGIRSKGLETPEYVTTLVNENIRNCNAQLTIRNERTKNSETRSSTSSKTIMHSSIIKAAVEVHQKAPLPSNKIIIPDRPFKNIGLEEKETITFQKPKAPAVNLLTEDNNSVSTGSFSDRDDYDFGSLSCDDEVSVRESNDKNQKNNTTESSSESSRATAKTFENKSLIMGRIFKNASTKAAIKTSTVNAVKVKSVGVQKDQTLVPKADLNQLFDELRGNSGVDVVPNDRICNSTVNDNYVIAGNSRANHKQYTQQRDNIKSFVPAASPPAVVSSTTVTLPTKERKPKARVSRAKSNAEAKSRKNITKLQSELGMSPDEIKKLIDEGQRKSKRRCATNRPKKLIEMWSSDEYEEFLSTKDIIALIEEKEQQEEKRKKRKNSLNASSTTTEVAKEKEIINADVSSSTKEPKRRNTRRMSMAADHPDNLLNRGEELLPPKNIKTKKAINKREEPVSTTANITNASELSVSEKYEKPSTQKGKGKRTTKANLLKENSFTTNPSDNKKAATKKDNSNSKNAVNKTKNQKTTPKTKKLAQPKAESSRTKYKKHQYDDDDDDSTEEEGVNDNIDNDDDDDDDDDDFVISELKSKQKKARAAAKVKTKKSIASNSAAIVTSTANAKTTKQTATPKETPSKKRSPNNNNAKCNNSNVINATKNQLQHNQQTSIPAKTKRKTLSNQSPPRRKRLATEKLYYWSSSSDEEFGLIDKNKSNPPPQSQPPPPTVNFENNGEQYQKHGWIVGDSHKKLVTLLAIAKGNKKIDSNSSVKKNISKKRN